MLGEEISTEGPIHLYCSQPFNPFHSQGEVQLKVTIEQSH